MENRSRKAALGRERKDPKPRSPINQLTATCFFAQFDPEHECEGHLVRCHLVKEQFLRDSLRLTAEERWHPEFWVEGCGGATGLAGHHGRFDAELIEVPREALPERIEKAAVRYPRVGTQLTRRFGPRPSLIERAA